MKNIFRIDIGENRIYGLDILRCIAILFVVFAHGIYLLGDRISNLLGRFDFDGVSLFFVLSGFLIGGILIKILETQVISLKTLKNFWIRRWFRTIPNYFLILTFLMGLHIIIFRDISLWRTLNYFVFLQNLFYKNPYFFNEAWSLSVEEWFYLLIPILVFCLVGIFHLNIKASILSTAFSVLIIVTFFRLYRYSNIHANTLSIQNWDSNFRKQVFTRLDSLVFGVLGAYISNYYNTLWIKYKNQLFFIGIFIMSIQITHTYDANSVLYYTVFTFPVTSIGTLCLLPYLSNMKYGKGTIYKVVTYISIISYSIYLLNFTLILNNTVSFIHLNFLPEVLRIITRYCIFWSLTLFLSFILYKYYEAPMTKLREVLK